MFTIGLSHYRIHSIHSLALFLSRWLSLRSDHTQCLTIHLWALGIVMG